MNPSEHDLDVSHRNLLHPGSVDSSTVQHSVSPSCHQSVCVDRISAPMTDSAAFNVVPRVPQPYYTSLSAVTRPMVVPCSRSKDVAVRSIASAPNMLGVRRRTTSPGCIRPQTSRSCGPVGCNAKPPPPSCEHHSSVTDTCDKPAPEVPLSVAQQHLLAETQENIRKIPSNCDLVSELSRLQSVSAAGTQLQTAVDFSVECQNNLQQSDILHLDKHMELISSSQPCNTERNVLGNSDTQFAVSTEITERILEKNTDLPQDTDKRLERSRTLPAATQLKYSQPTAVSDLSASHKSRSLSFANFLRRVSPKSIRRLMSLAAPDNHKSPARTDNCSPNNFDCFTHSSIPSAVAVLQESSTPSSGVATPSKKSATRSPLRKWFDRRKSKDHPSIASPSLSCSGIEIDVGYGDELLAVDSVCFSDDTAVPRTCYSDISSKIPVALDNTNVLRGRPLQIVEFPDDLINAEQCSPTRTDSSVVSRLPAAGCEQTNSDTNRSVGSCTGGGVWRLHDPPTTLDVRAVYRLPSHFLQFPCCSVESIGQCSLDVASVTRVGSETSLIKSSLPSSVTASRRTLTSHDSITAVHEQPTDQIQQLQQHAARFDVTDNAISHAADDLISSSRDDVGIRSPPPSYLQLSRCAGGYSTFTGYAPDRTSVEHRNGAPYLNGSVGSSGGSVHDHRPAGVAVSAASSVPVVTTEPRHCRLTLVDDVVTDVSIIPRDTNGRAGCAKELTPYQNGISSASTATAAAAAATAVLELQPTNGSIDALPTSVKKDGSYFLQLVDNEQRRLLELCSRTECHLQDAGQPIHEEVEGKIRLAIGKANLLTSQKFRQFRQLCDKNLCETGQEPFCTTDADLAGFWDMVLLQVADVDRLFDEVNRLRLNNWKIPDVTPPSNELNNTVNSATNRPPAAKGKPMPRHARPTATATVKSSTRAESKPNKSREEARSRLMAAKMAGRQRKTSDSEKDVEIFVS